jgi:hypothetical protein
MVAILDGGVAVKYHLIVLLIKKGGGQIEATIPCIQDRMHVLQVPSIIKGLYMKKGKHFKDPVKFWQSADWGLTCSPVFKNSAVN